MERASLIEKAYQVIGSPIDPNLKCGIALEDIVDYSEAEPGEPVVYFASPAQDREDTTLYSMAADGSITYHKVTGKVVTPLTFVGRSSALETFLIDELMNSQDATAVASKKDGIIRSLDNKEAKECLDLILAVASQKVSKVTGNDILDVIIKMKEKVANFATDYILLAASDVINKIESYDVDNKTVYNYRMGIKETLATIGVNKIVKVLGTDGTTAVLAAGKIILVGRNSNLVVGNQRPLSLIRRKANKLLAEMCGCKEGDVRLLQEVPMPVIVNAAGANTFGIGLIGYESLIECLKNFRAVSWSNDILS